MVKQKKISAKNASSPKSVNSKSKQPKPTLKFRISSFMSRRPHRSFRRTLRRDYVRSLELPGYIAFTFFVIRTLRERWRTFLTLTVFFTILNALLVGLASQDMYQTLTDTLQQTSQDIFTGGWGEIGKAGLLLGAIASGNIGSELTEAQQIYSILVFLLLWLTTVWLLRAQLIGKTPRFRDGLYNSGSPIIPTLLVMLLLVVQLVPAAFAVVAYNAAIATNFMANGAVAMTLSVALLLLCVLSLYWITSTLIALVVVTLPGMYPWQAIRTAGDLVVGRRFRILLRLLWMALVVVITWLVVMVPVILLNNWLQQVIPFLARVPVIPIALLLISIISAVFAASYVYLLYRKVVDDDAAPA